MCSQTLLSRNVIQKVYIQTCNHHFWRIRQRYMDVETDGPAQNATSSNDCETAFVPPRCCLLVSDHGSPDKSKGGGLSYSGAFSLWSIRNCPFMLSRGSHRNCSPPFTSFSHIFQLMANLYPEVGKVVMIHVKSIDDEGATCSLLEFKNMEGRIPNPCRTVVGRIEPVLVSNVEILDDEEHRVITLSRSGVSVDARGACELKYLQSKLAETILRRAAMLLKRDDLHGLVSPLPSYDDLKNSEYLDSLPKDLRAALVAAVEDVKYESCRMKFPSVIYPCSLYENNGFCWAVALIRQLEALLKIKGMMPMDEHLSIQDLINQMSPDLFVDGAGDIERLDEALTILVNQGVVLESICPTTFAMPNGVSLPGTKYKALSAVVVDTDYAQGNDSGITYMESLLNTGPTAATVVSFESYRVNNPNGSGIHQPTEEEWKYYLAHRFEDVATHTMLLTAWGVDEHGVKYWEFQDSHGDVNNGDRGFLRFLQYPDLILEFVEMEV